MCTRETSGSKLAAVEKKTSACAGASMNELNKLPETSLGSKSPSCVDSIEDL